MTDGRSILHRIDGSIAQARQKLGETARRTSDQASQLRAVEQAERAAYQVIADIRIESLRGDEIVGTLEAADKRAQSLMAEHDQSLSQAAQIVDANRNALEEAERERRDMEETFAKADARHDAQVEKTYARLQSDDVYQEKANALEHANAIAERARKKLDVVRNDRKNKGAPYEQDPLFSYLWERKFATKDYRAFFLFAGLDRWVARLIKYRDAKLNYQRLLELPERFQEHVDGLEANADDIAGDLEVFEREALEKDGVTKQRDAVDAAQTHLDEIDVKIAQAEDALQSSIDKQSDIAAGEAGPMREARDLIQSVVSKRSIPDLKILAAQTVALEDDRRVDDLIRLERERFEIAENQRGLDRQRKKDTKTLSEVEQLRRKFKAARFDSPYSEFSDSNVISFVLTELLDGALSHHDAMRRLRRVQRRRQRDWSDDFGGDAWRDGFGLPGTAGPGTGGYGGGRTVPKFPRQPRRMPRNRPRRARPPRIRIPKRGGGGFRTGGGF